MHIYEFGPFRVDTLRRVLLRDGENVRLPAKAFEILLVLLQAEGRLVEKDELMKKVWPDAVVEENNLTVNMSALRKGLAESPGEHRYVVTIPGRGYQFVAKVQLHHGESKEFADVDNLSLPIEVANSQEPRVPSTTTRENKKFYVLGLVLLVLVAVTALVSYVVYSRRQSSKPEGVITSIAVLPFENVTGDSNAEYLSDGIAESLINRLSQLQGVKVIARSSAFRYKGKQVDLKEVAHDLDVEAVLIGRVTQRGDSLSISSELVNANDRTQIWGEHYDRKMSDLLEIQREITREIIGTLKLKISPAEKGTDERYSESNEAYQLYLKGRFYWNKRTAEAVQRAIEYFNQAIEKDPRFALAYVGLADSYVVPANRLPPVEAMPKAKAAARQALELNERLAEAHASLGRALASYDWDWSNAEKEYKRAIELNPRYAVAHQWYGQYLAIMGRGDESIAERRLAVELEPLSLTINFDFGLGFYFNRDYDQAIQQFQKTLELDEDFPFVHNFLPAAYEQKGMYREALAGFRKALTVTVGSEGSLSNGGLGHLYAVMGKKTQARTSIEELQQLSTREFVPATSIAMIYAGLNEKDEAFTWLERAYVQHAFQLQSLALDARWDSLRSDPRFENLIKRMGIPLVRKSTLRYRVIAAQSC